METVQATTPIFVAAINIGLAIHSLIEPDLDKKSILVPVGQRIHSVNNLLEHINKNDMLVDKQTVEGLVEGLKELRKEVERVKKIGRFMYLLLRKDCQEILKKRVDTVQFYLQSLNVNQTNSLREQSEEIKRQNEEIKRMLAQLVVKTDADVEKQLEREDEEANQLRGQLKAKELDIEHLESMGLGTIAELRGALQQADEERIRLLKDKENTKRTLEADYLVDVIQLLKDIDVLAEETTTSCQTPEQIHVPSGDKTDSVPRDGAGLQRRFWMMRAFIALVILAIVISIVVFVLRRMNQETEPVTVSSLIPTSHPTSSPTTSFTNSSTRPNPNPPTNPPTSSPTSSPTISIPVGFILNGEAAGDLFGWSVALSSDGNRVAIGGIGDSGQVRIYDLTDSQWKQVGPSLDGDVAGDDFGIRIALSNDGNRVVISAPSNVGNGDSTGNVRTYDWTGNQWTQVGSDLDGESAGDESGFSVSLSSDGNRLAIGAPFNDGPNGDDAGHVRIYNWNESQWTQVGSDLDGEAGGDLFGYSVALSSDGNRVVIGAPLNSGKGNTSGLVQIYDWTGSQWMQIGSNLDGAAAGEEFGSSVALSSEGNRIVIGAPSYSGQGNSTGQARIYDWTGTQWTQVGSDLVAEAVGDKSGFSTAISSDGNRVIIGAPFNTLNGMKAGLVRMYEWTRSDWMQMVPILVGEAAGDEFGYSIALSSKGDRVVIGAPFNEWNGENSGHVRIYNWTDSQWTQVGSNLDGESDSDSCGYSVALSSDGNRLAIGAPFNDGPNGDGTGHVRIYEWTKNQWTQVGSDLDGEAAGDSFGYRVALSANGNRVVIGAPLNAGNGIESGQVLIYDWTGSQWELAGSDLEGAAAGDEFGSSVALSSDGNRVVIGSFSDSENGNAAGYVRIYDWTGSQWTQAGSDLMGEGADDRFGTSVAISSDGSRVAIGGILNDSNGIDAGHVRIYDWTGSQWMQVGFDLDAEAAGDASGISIALSSDGTRVAIGAPGNDGNGEGAGHVRIYDWTGSQWTQAGSDLDGEATGDWFGWSVALSSAGTRVAIGATKYESDAGHVRVFDWTGSEWMQVGSNLNGEAAGDQFGRSVALSSDGARVAIGAPFNSFNGLSTGRVGVFNFIPSKIM